jgi:DNA polymerase
MSTNYITVDFETYYDGEYSLRSMPTPAYVMHPLFEVICVAVSVNGDAPVTFTGTMNDTRKFLCRYSWEAEGTTTVIHNAQFDGAILEWVFNIKPSRYFCTMMGSRPFVYPYTNSMALKSVAAYFGLEEKGADVADAKKLRRYDFEENHMRSYMEYCAKDVRITAEVYRRLRDMMPPQEQIFLDLTVKKFTRPRLRCNYLLVREHSLQVEAEKLLLINSVDATKAQLSSNAMFAKLLEAECVPVPMKKSPATGLDVPALSKDDVGFRQVMNNYGDRVRRLCEARLAVKSTQIESRLKTFDAIATAMDGLFPCHITYWAARTGRNGGSDSTNLQNLTRGSILRRVLEAPPGSKLIAADFSQIEARILAVLAGEPRLIDSFANKGDPYSDLASRIYGKAINKKDNPDERFIGKVGILGLGYGMGAQGFINMLEVAHKTVDITFAQNVVDSYRSMYPRVPMLWQQVKNMIAHMANGNDYRDLGISVAKGVMWLPNDMPIYYPNLEHDKSTGNYIYGSGSQRYTLYGGKLVENIVQALARNVMVEAELRLAKHGLESVLNVHDELVFVVPDNRVHKAVRAIELVMSTPPKWMPTLPIAAEIGVGSNYGECK